MPQLALEGTDPFLLLVSTVFLSICLSLCVAAGDAERESEERTGEKGR